jgi:hypothetical protein
MNEKKAPPDNFVFTPEDIEIDWVPISDQMKNSIVKGIGVTDRSAFLLRASTALISAGLNQQEVLTILTDPNLYLGKCAYDHAQTKDRKAAALWLYRYTFQKMADARSPKKSFEDMPIEDPEEMSFDEMLEQDADAKKDKHWTSDILRGGERGDGAPKPLVGNVVLILQNAVSPSLVVRDEFTLRDTYGCKTPWGAEAGALATDDDISNIKYWLGQQWGFEPKKDIIYDALIVIACQNAFDPVKDMLNALPAWDGVSRLNSWLKNNFEAEGHPEYLAQVFRKWMFAMVLRVFEPGSKFDWMPIFEGAQGVGKSSFGRLLVGDRYFLDWLPNLSDKDSALSLQGMWGVEMGELSQFRKNELESIKAFVTRTVDKLRPPYGRRLMECPRRCVFFGTTNRAKYLTDDTGNRRFKPILVGNLNFMALKRDREQLFAEAKYLYDQKIETVLTLELTGDAKIFEREIHAQKMMEDDSNVMLELMQEFVEKEGENPTGFDFTKFKIADLFGGGGCLDRWKLDNRNSQFAGKMLKKLGAEKREIGGRNFWKMEI